MVSTDKVIALRGKDYDIQYANIRTAISNMPESGRLPDLGYYHNPAQEFWRGSNEKGLKSEFFAPREENGKSSHFIEVCKGDNTYRKISIDPKASRIMEATLGKWETYQNDLSALLASL